MSPWYSSELCIQVGLSFLFSLVFSVSSFLSYLQMASSDSHFAFLHFFFLRNYLSSLPSAVAGTPVKPCLNFLSGLC